MADSFGSRLKHAWNAFFNRDPTPTTRHEGVISSYRPDRPRLTKGNEKSIVNAIFNRIAMDIASLDIKHCRLDDNGRYIEDIDSKLNKCLNLEANLDQTGRAFIQDIVMSMLDEGSVAVIPVDTETDPLRSGSYDILTMRTGKIMEWRPTTIKVRLYNEQTGQKEDIVVPKKIAAIIENPLYSVINEPNSTMQRLIRKLNLLDAIDEQSGAGKLDLIIQLPYVIKTDARRKQAEERRKDIEMQLSGSKYGIAYTDGTERITQLNRPVENNLLKQIEFLTSMLYGQLGFTQTVLDGTADEKTMLNYNTRTVEPIASAIVDELKRKFLTKTAITQKQSIEFFRDPFKLVPISSIADIADRFTRNEILSSNEVRGIIGMKPSNDPKADVLLNKNIAQPMDPTMIDPNTADPSMADPGMTEDPSMVDPGMTEDPSMVDPGMTEDPSMVDSTTTDSESPEEPVEDMSLDNMTVNDLFELLSEEDRKIVGQMIVDAVEEDEMESESEEEDEMESESVEEDETESESESGKPELDNRKVLEELLDSLTEDQQSAVLIMIDEAVKESKKETK